MEHEVFQSKLKPSVDDALLPSIIRSSSSGEHSHRAAAMELVLERSIQERRERMSTKAKDPVEPDPPPQLKRSEPPKDPIPPAELPVPVDAPQPPPQPSPKDPIQLTELPVPVLAAPPPSQPSSNAGADVPARPASSPITHEVSPDLSTPLKPIKKSKKAKKATRREEPQADVKMDPPPPEVVVQLACQSCSVKQQRSHLQYGIYCCLCVGPLAIMKCVGCGAIRDDSVEACASCHGKFE